MKNKCKMKNIKNRMENIKYKMENILFYYNIKNVDYNEN